MTQIRRGILGGNLSCCITKVSRIGRGRERKRVIEREREREHKRLTHHFVFSMETVDLATVHHVPHHHHSSMNFDPHHEY